MKLFAPQEIHPGENRVSLSPETVGKLIGLGFSVAIESGAGSGSRIPDEKYEAAGASIASGSRGIAEASGEAEVILKVRRPSAGESKGYGKGALVLALMDPHGNEAEIEAMAKAGLCGFAMDLMPRVTRAQTMDALSSQANLAGYRAVIEAASHFERAFPMMMTAAGTIPAAKIFVMGAGVAGLQAIATARRLGAVVSATDVRPAAKEQVASLGAKFIAVEDEEFKAAETAAGYAKEMSAEYKAKQAELIASHLSGQDVVITTALIPGRKAPVLVSRKMLESMSPGSVAVDLAAERGGNVEGSEPDRIAGIGGVDVIAYSNMAGRIAATASQLYARNLLAFLQTMIDAEAKALKVDWEDELIQATLLTRGGKVVHPEFGGPKPTESADAKAGK